MKTAFCTHSPHRNVHLKVFSPGDFISRQSNVSTPGLNWAIKMVLSSIRTAIPVHCNRQLIYEINTGNTCSLPPPPPTVKASHRSLYPLASLHTPYAAVSTLYL